MKLKNLGVVFALGTLIALCPLEGTKAEEANTISKGVYIGDVDVSGMTKEEATKAVEDKLGKGTGGTYTVQVGEETVTATAEDFGMAWNNQEVVDEAMAVAKSGNIIKRYKD